MSLYLLFFQSRKRLYNHKCPFVCLSVTKTPQQIKINHSTLPTTTPQHHTQHHNTIRHYITHTSTHTHTNQHPHNHASGATFKPSHTTSHIPSYTTSHTLQLTDWLMTPLPSSLQPKLASLIFATFKTFCLVFSNKAAIRMRKREHPFAISQKKLMPEQTQSCCKDDIWAGVNIRWISN